MLSIDAQQDDGDTYDYHCWKEEDKVYKHTCVGMLNRQLHALEELAGKKMEDSIRKKEVQMALQAMKHLTREHKPIWIEFKVRDSFLELGFVQGPISMSR